MILETYQAEQEIKPEEEQQTAYGTITEVTENGLIVLFDGEETASRKAYACNVSVDWKTGARVLLQKINGEYIAMAPIGKKHEGGGSGGSVKRYSTYIERSWNNGFVSWSVTSPVSNAIGIVDVYSNNSKVMANFGFIPDTDIISMLVWNPSSAVTSRINYTILYTD